MSIGSHAKTARVVTGFVLAATVLLSSCGSGDSDSPATSTAKSPNAATSAPANTGARKTAAVTVTVDDMSFSPENVTVKVGDTVAWKFSDRYPHSVQGIGDKAMGINSPIFTTGEWSYTFTAPGTYRYLCSLHPQMRGTVTVE
ncbi:cupredoxin family copper-binding protein [Nocardia sp. NPDC005366]|uniref:cupredoxin domain-containing protein n=1 Tax=Nocardia sp. NPDC005366 TaxID=3156878 RepID=UPI0033B5F03A